MTLNTQINRCNQTEGHKTVIYLSSQLPKKEFSEGESNYFNQKMEAGSDLAMLITPDKAIFIHQPDLASSLEKRLEKTRMTANKIYGKLRDEKLKTVTLVASTDLDTTLAFIEGLLLSTYQFDKYKSKKEEYALTDINLIADIPEQRLTHLRAAVEGVFVARNLVNEPVNALNAVQLSQEVSAWGNACGFKVDVLHREAIEQQKMGGLLAVNQGSTTPPTFSILEWKPKNATGKPIVLVGKGVMFDTGGINLKVHPGGLDDMKSDMAGAAAVIGTFVAAAKANLPIHLIGLIPATDNRPGNNAIVPGDVITMYDGTTVEILNTDAEGRLILADAIAFANQFDPQLIVELSTLTGSTVMALGSQGMAAMGTANNLTFAQLEQAGNKVHERMARFPFWEEYEELIKSDVADLKNIGGREAGAITAGKFLSHFTTYPFIHLDIAGVAFSRKENGYRGLGATGTGVRLLLEFIGGMAGNEPEG